MEAPERLRLREKDGVWVERVSAFSTHGTEYIRADVAEQIPRCPCGGKLEGVGYDRREKTVEFECNACASQISVDKEILAYVSVEG